MIIALDAAAALRAVSAEVCEELFAPPPRLTVSEWADANRVLPQTSAEPGRFRTDRIPYLRAIQDALGDERIREVVFAKSAQVAGSTAGESWLGYLIDQDPCAILSVWPTEKKLKWWSTKRLAPMLQDTPCLAVQFPKTGRRDSSDSIFSKEFANGYLQLLTSKSTADLRSADARTAIAEEVDEWEGDIGGQGDPLELLRTRGRTFWNFKLFLVSTPTLDGFSRIWRELESSSWQEYWVPCPACGCQQRLVWQDDAGQYRLICDRDAAGQLVPESARYACEGCGVLIEERAKQGMLERGEWVARFPERRKVGFHINTLYSPLCPWSEVVAVFLRSRHSDAALQVFDNNTLGVPHKTKGEQLEAALLKARVEPYPRDPGAPADDVEGELLPRGIGFLTAAVDVQGDRLELVVWGWGAAEESWVVRWIQIEGDPGQDLVWTELDEWLLRPWRHEGGATLQVTATAIDAGYQTERAWRFAEARRHRRVIATVGRDGRGRKLIEAPGPQARKTAGANRKRPMHVVGVDSGKDLLAARLRIARPETGPAPAGYIHFPDSLDPVFFDQLTAEKLVTGYVKGRPVRQWRLIEGRRNEALDLAVLAAAALAYSGAGVIRQLSALVQHVNEQGASLRVTAMAQPAAPSSRRIRSRGLGD